MSKVYRIGEFAERVGRSASTVRRWEREGLLTPNRTRSGQRYFTEADVRSVLNLAAGTAQHRSTVIYCRVSSSGQRGDLESQVASMDQFCLANGITVDERVREIGGGMNLHRPKFLELMDRIEDGQVEHLLVAHQDRLARFGFDYLNHVAQRNGCRITVVNAETLSPQHELVEDLLAIVHMFSCRLYGLRRYEKQMKDEFGGGS